VDSRFVSEDEFGDQLRRSAVLLLPYTNVYQSGVAVRAAEASVPVVGSRNTNVGDLYGHGWPGLVDDDSDQPRAQSWADAVDRVLAARATTAADHVQAYRSSSLSAWGGWVGRL
jgi:glycosyltransferase involved in cell wall biosynthesis